MSYIDNQYIEITSEDKLLLLCARTQQNSNTYFKLIKLLNNDLNWDYIIKKGFHHRLIPLLYWNLKEFGEQIPKSIFKDLKDIYVENAKKNLAILGELFILLDIFKKHDVVVIPYKGPIIAIHAYNNVTLRQFDDIDIFINKKDYFKVKEILISNGYVPQFILEGYKERRFINSQRELKFYNHDKDLTVEIHWHFQGVSFSLSDTDFFGCFKTIEINGIEILSLSNEDMLLVLCIHLSGHLWERLSWLCDISELISSQKINWEYVFKKADELGVKRLLLINLNLLEDLLNIDLQNEVRKQFKSEIIKNHALEVKKRIFYPKSFSLLQNMMLRLNIREKRNQGMKDILKIMFLPTNKEWDKSISKSLFPPISYCYRLTNVITKQ